MKNQKGITLVALIITIIVMLILVTVTLTIVLGENGIINKARQASNETNDAYAIERRVFEDDGNTAKAIDNYVSGSAENFVLSTNTHAE